MSDRIIKFRVWDTETKSFLRDVGISKDGQVMTYDFHGTDEKQYCQCLYQQNFVVQQFTNRKDKNGVDIYEGDICNIRRYEHLDRSKKWLVAEVLWGCEYGWNFRTYFGKEFIGTRFTEVDEVEVIGNIYETER